MAAVKPDPGQENGGAEQKPDVQKIKITVRFGQDRDDLQINVKPHTPFSKIYRAVAEHQGKSEDSFRLTFDGDTISKTATPASLEFGEEEAIDMHIAQIGGGAVKP